jgi:predicted amidohydrolase
MAEPVRVACCQFAPEVAAPEGNASRALAEISQAVATGADIVVLPELCVSGYVFADHQEVRAAAVRADDDLLAGWAHAAAVGGAIVIGGFCELGADGRIYNSSALVGGDGVIAVYRKVHLWGEEAIWFSLGGGPPPVVDTAHGRVGLAVCYDLEFPELTRGLALDGAQLIALPTNWPRKAVSPFAPHSVLTALAGVVAYVNRVFVAVCDRCGTERGLEFEGGSVIAAPDGGLRCGPRPGHDAGILLADCDLAEAQDKANGPRNDAFRDRRPAHYSSRLVTETA